MIDLRVLVVAPSVWPIPDSRSLVASGLAMELGELVRSVTVVARHPVAHWPSRFYLGRAEVHRLALPSRRVLGSLRLPSTADAWSREVGRWISSRCSEFDLAIAIVGETGEAEIVRAIRRCQIPALIRVEKPASPLLKQAARGEADGVRCVVPRPLDGFDDIPVIADGFLTESGQAIGGGALRRALGEAHPMLAISAKAPLAICSAPLEREQGVFELVAAWETVARSFPDARLWMVSGSGGSAGHFLYQSVRDLDLMHSIIFPGAFDAPCDLVAASDGVVLPSSQTPVDPIVNIAIARRKNLIAHSSHPAIPGACPFKFGGEEPGLAETLCRWASHVIDSPHPLSEETQPVESGTMREMALQYLDLARTIPGVPLKS